MPWKVSSWMEMTDTMAESLMVEMICPAIGLQDALRTAPDSVKAVAGVLIGRLDQVDAFVTAAFTLGLYEGAYVAEIVRGGIRSVRKK